MSRRAVGFVTQSRVPRVPEAFYVATEDGFEPTELTRGPWDANSQHMGPPAALLGRALERLPGAEGSPGAPGAEGEDVAGVVPFQVGRVTYEVLRPVPIAPLTLSAQVERPGRRVQMVSASLADSEGVVVRARGWRIARSEVEIPAGLASEEPGGPAGRWTQPPPPEQAEEGDFFDTGHDVGYHTGVEYRFVEGRFLEPGPGTVWMRMRVPLVAGEEPTPLQRVLACADTGNGISGTLDFRRYLFINVDLTVHLHRMPAGEWVCLDAITIPEPTGIGLADTQLADERGPIGRACQTLLIAPADGAVALGYCGRAGT